MNNADNVTTQFQQSLERNNEAFAKYAKHCVYSMVDEGAQLVRQSAMSTGVPDPLISHIRPLLIKNTKTMNIEGRVAAYSNYISGSDMYRYTSSGKRVLKGMLNFYNKGTKDRYKKRNKAYLGYITGTHFFDDAEAEMEQVMTETLQNEIDKFKGVD